LTILSPFMESWKKNLYVLWGAQFLAMVGMNLVIPFLPFFVRQLGVSNDQELARWSGIVFAGPFMTAFLATPVWGTMADRYGQKLMVVRAIFGLGISQVLCGFSQDVIQLLLFRMLQGAISGFISATLALVSTSSPKEKIGYSLGLLQSATAGGTVLGPAIGGVLADIIGYREIFFVTAAFCFVSGFAIIRLVHVPPHAERAGNGPSVGQNLSFMFRHKQLRLIAVTIIIGQGAALMIEPIFALFIEGFGTTTRYISSLTGLIIAIAGIFMVFSAPWWGRRNDRFGAKSTLLIALAGTGVSYGLHILVPDLVTLGFLRGMLGFMRGGILHTLYALTNQYAPAHRRSGLIGIASSMAILGNLFGPLAGGAVAGTYGLTAVFVVNSTLFLGTALIVWRFLANTPHPAIPEEVRLTGENIAG
jgi:DHA1 family multidrug resistance protein-like MFS transporter